MWVTVAIDAPTPAADDASAEKPGAPEFRSRPTVWMGRLNCDAPEQKASARRVPMRNGLRADQCRRGESASDWGIDRLATDPLRTRADVGHHDDGAAKARLLGRVREEVTLEGLAAVVHGALAAAEGLHECTDQPEVAASVSAGGRLHLERCPVSGLALHDLDESSGVRELTRERAERTVVAHRSLLFGRMALHDQDRAGASLELEVDDLVIDDVAASAEDADAVRSLPERSEAALVAQVFGDDGHGPATRLGSR